MYQCAECTKVLVAVKERDEEWCEREFKIPRCYVPGNCFWWHEDNLKKLACSFVIFFLSSGKVSYIRIVVLPICKIDNLLPNHLTMRSSDLGKLAFITWGSTPNSCLKSKLILISVLDGGTGPGWMPFAFLLFKNIISQPLRITFYLGIMPPI